MGTNRIIPKLGDIVQYQHHMVQSSGVGFIVKTTVEYVIVQWFSCNFDDETTEFSKAGISFNNKVYYDLNILTK